MRRTRQTPDTDARGRASSPGRLTRFAPVAALLALAAAPAPAHASPPAPVSVTAMVDHGELPAGASHSGWLRVTVLGAALPEARRPPLNVAIAIDKSRAMTGARLAHTRAAVRAALDSLAPDDLLSVIAFNGTVEVLVPPTPAREADRVMALLEPLSGGPRSALFAGVSRAAAELRKFKARETLDRIVLIADGPPTVGPGSPADLARLGASLRRERIAVTTVALGDRCDHDGLVALSRASGGQHHAVTDPEQLAALFRSGFAGLAAVVATDLDVRVSFAPGVRPDRALGDAALRGQTVSAAVTQIHAGDDLDLLVGFEVTPSGPPSQAIARVEVRLFDPIARATRTAEASAQIRVSAGPSAPSGADSDLLATAAEAAAVDASRQALDAEPARARALLDGALAETRAAATTFGSDRLAALARELERDLELLGGAEWARRSARIRARVDAHAARRVSF